LLKRARLATSHDREGVIFGAIGTVAADAKRLATSRDREGVIFGAIGTSLLTQHGSQRAATVRE